MVPCNIEDYLVEFRTDILLGSLLFSLWHTNSHILDAENGDLVAFPLYMFYNRWATDRIFLPILFL